MKEQKMSIPTKKVAKVPVVMQLEALECGAASLSMILAYYNKWLPIEQVRVDCGVSRDGSSASNVCKAAINYGLDVEAYSFEVDEIKKEATFPCIIHWNFNHFVVLCGFKGKYAYINDPARGDVKVSMEEFDNSFTGICLMFNPTEKFVPSGRRKTTFAYVKEKLKGLGPLFTYGIGLTVLTSIIGLVTPVFNRIFYDNILPKANPDWVNPFLNAFIIIGIFQLILNLLTVVYSYKASGKLDAIGSSNFLMKVLRLPMRFFSQRMTGDIVSRKDSNATIAYRVINTVAPLFIQLIMMVLYFIIMINYSWILTCIALISTITNVIVSKIIADKRMNATRVLIRDQAKSDASKVAGLEMIDTIKASGAEDGYFRMWAGYQASSYEGKAKYDRVSYYYNLIPEIVSAISSTAILFVGLYLTIKGEFTLGMITAFDGYLSSFLYPVSLLISAGQDMQEMQTEIERVDDVMNYPDDSIFEGEKVKVDNYVKLSGNIEIQNVTFGYSPLAEPLIKDFSMKIAPGKSVAFVGTSGCGKSTLSKLISGIEKPWSGEILFDGKKINEINRDIFTGSVSVVDQDIIIFEDTVRNNIKMYDNTIEDFEMIMACKDAQLHDGIMQREGGYDYVLSEGGKDFSGGQRQRLEIARVLAMDPTICILDEATSALDAKTEYDVVQAIKERGITCIIIAHRLSTIRDCDEIIVLDHGNVLERGTHDELIKKKAAYYRLISAD